MTTSTLTKVQARQAIYNYNWANEDLKRKDLAYLEREAKLYDPRFSNIMDKNGAFVWVSKEFEGIIDCHEMRLHNVVMINEETYSIEELIEFIGDLTDEEQHDKLEQLDVSAIQLYIKKRTGMHVTLHKELYKNRQDKWCLKLYSDNLVEHTGICKAMLKEIYIECRGIGFGVDRETGEQELWIPSLHFSYVHQDAGTNGHDFGRVAYNGNEFLGYNYETREYEVI